MGNFFLYSLSMNIMLYTLFLTISILDHQDGDVPWHLIAIAVFLTLLKVPGPYYPYWGRFFVPHFANGGLLRVFIMMYFWYQSPKKSQLLHNVESSEQN